MIPPIMAPCLYVNGTASLMHHAAGIRRMHIKTLRPYEMISDQGLWNKARKPVLPM
jgi:hypothetical protein